MNYSSLLAGLLLCAGLSAQSVIVVPPGADLAEQNTLTSPQPISGLNALAGTGSTSRTQYIYDAANFTALGVTTPVVITKLRFRANGAAATWTGGTVSNLKLDMSTAPADYLAMTNTFDNNHGLDRLTAYDTSVTVVGGSSTTAATGTAPGGTFVAELDLATNGTPFAYYPALGDLCLDFMTAGVTGAVTGQIPNWDTLSTGALSRRSFSNNNGQFVATGTTPAASAVVIEITYIPFTGLFPAYSVSTTRGTSPLSVDFTDLSSSSVGPITSWAWDFENDGIDDDFTANPTHVFPCGNYSVKLTVSDGINTQSVLYSNLVQTDLVVPSFTFAATPAVGAPGRVQFTDTTTPAATAWDWDFDGDMVTDSTLQNPTFDFADYAAHDVRLIASRNCAVGSTVTRRVVAGNSLTTTFAGGSAGTTNWSVMFDLNVTNPLGIEIKAADLRWNAVAGNPVQADVYITPGTCVGVERISAPWRKVATGTALAAGSGLPTLTSFNNSVYLAPGTYGVLFHGVVGGLDYSGSSTLGTYGNADVSFSNSRVHSNLFSPTASLFIPRVWNGTLYYATYSGSSEASYGYFANGCAGTFGTPRTQAATQPSVGSTFLVDFTNLPNDQVVVMWGWNRTTSVFGPLPVDLTSYGLTGCTGYVSPDFVQFMIGAPFSATVTWSFAVPVWPALLGAPFYMQGLVLDSGFNAAGATMSDAGAGVIGL
jgi:PKD repeat protein